MAESFAQKPLALPRRCSAAAIEGSGRGGTIWAWTGREEAAADFLPWEFDRERQRGERSGGQEKMRKR
jgi:hypothetical protein